MGWEHDSKTKEIRFGKLCLEGASALKLAECNHTPAQQWTWSGELNT